MVHLSESDPVGGSSRAYVDDVVPAHDDRVVPGHRLPALLFLGLFQDEVEVGVVVAVQDARVGASALEFHYDTLAQVAVEQVEGTLGQTRTSRKVGRRQEAVYITVRG